MRGLHDSDLLVLSVVRAVRAGRQLKAVVHLLHVHKPRVEKLDQAVELGDLPVVGQVVVPHPVDRPLHLPGVLEDRALRQVKALEALVLHPVQAQVHRVELLLHRLRIVSLHSIAERTD